ncbi:proline iminopeptidase [Streptomyces hygroscopicus subsp. limoneus]|nr:proline iminopeptidase [Streptomyces hygroscopicus subsp. limoneus]
MVRDPGPDARWNRRPGGLGTLFPAAFEAFLAGVPAEDRDGDLAAACTGSSHPPAPRSGSGPRGPGPTGRRSLPAPPRSVDRFQDPVFRQGLARTVTHYWGNGRFLGDDGGKTAERDGVVLRDAHRLKGIPGTLVQGSLGFGNLLGTVWRLRRA